jgi:cob(I)alamin adenosyltransferase
VARGRLCYDPRMVVLNKIYTRTGDDGTTGLVGGERVGKTHPRIEACGAVDETNAALGLARVQALKPALDEILARVQNELFDLGADLATPERPGRPLGWNPLRITEAQVGRLEADIDRLNADLSPLNSFVLPGGTSAAAALHLARTICRRAERAALALAASPDDPVGAPALKYLNRLSDLLFVAARWANGQGSGDVLWTPGATV